MGSGWHQAETTEDLQNMNKYAAGSLGAVTMQCINWIPWGQSAAEQMQKYRANRLQSKCKSGSKHCKLSRLQTLGLKGFPHSQRLIKERKAAVTQLYDIVQTSQVGPESAQEILPKAGGRAWESTGKQLWSTGLLALCKHVATISVYAKTFMY